MTAPVALPADTTVKTAPSKRPKRSRYRGIDQLNGIDRVVVALMVIIPTFLVVALVWFPAVGSVLLSFTNWNGIGSLSSAKFIGLTNYQNVVTIYPPFWPALQHNLIWLGFFLLIATPFGMFLAVLLDREIRGSRFYQGILFLPVILSLAIVGFIWELIYAPEQGLINNVLGRTQQGHIID